MLGILLSIGGYVHGQNSFTISGEMTCDSLRFTKQNITRLYLTRIIDGQETKVDSAEVKNKSFHFKGVAPEYAEVAFISGFDNGSIQLLLEPGDITIKPFDARYPVVARVGGTPDNEILRGYQELEDVFMQKAKQRLDALLRKYPVNENDTAFREHQRAVFYSNNMFRKIEVMKYFRQHLDSPVALYLIKYELSFMFSPNVVERQMLRALPASLHKHPVYADLVNQLRAANMKVGSLAPDIKGKTPDGKELKLSDLKGKYVLLDFWASWCAPCRREFPYIKQALDLPGNDRFVVLSYSIDSKYNDWTSCIDKNALKHQNWVHISTLKGWASEAAKLFNVSAVPKTVLLNPEGRIVAFDIRGEEMVAKIKRIIEGVEKYE